MVNVVFRTKTEVKEEPSKNENIVREQSTGSTTTEEVPYTQYKSEHGAPYTAKYFDLGDRWDVFNEEVSTIEDYVNRKIDSGEIANDVKAVEKIIKSMEKLHNVKDESRPVVKIGVIASYIKFLNDVEGVKFNWRKYNAI